MDPGNPTIDDATLLFCSDEHVTFVPASARRPGESWPVDLRGW
jgi:hypothetical protein